MAKVPGLKANKNNVSQEIDLEKITGLPVAQDKKLMREIAQEVIDFIVERTKSGVAVGSKKNLKSPYSKSYADSLPFKAAGKSRNEVNLTLSGDMLGSIDVVEETDKGFVIAVDPDQAGKAFGHISGFEGHPVLKGPKRPFFGVTVDELRSKILPKFKNDLKEIAKDEAKTQSEAIKLVEKIDFLLEDED